MFQLLEAVVRMCSVKKVILEISKNTFFYRIHPVAASELFDNNREILAKHVTS